MELLFNRYEKLRIWSPWRYNAVSAPIILDRGRAQWSPKMRPYERFVDHGGYLFPAVSGGVGINGGFSHMKPTLFFDLVDTSSSFSTLDINTSYTAGSAGIALGCGGFIPSAKTLSAFYFNINAYHGTAANVTSITTELRANNSSSSFKPSTGGAALATATVNPSSNTGWIKSGTLTYAMSALTYYWFIVAVASASGTDYITASHRDFNGPGIASSIAWNAAQTTNGWSTITVRNQAQAIVAIFNDGTAAGDPFTTVAAGANDTNQKGLYIDGVTEKLSVYGVVNYSAGSLVNATGVKLWEGSGAGPSGSPARSGTERLSSDGTVYVGCLFSSAYTLLKATPYRFTYYGSSNWSAPHRRQIGTVANVNSGVNTELAKAFPAGGGAYYTKESSGSWADTTTEFPMMDFYIADQVAISAGGGGGGAGSGQGSVIVG